MQTTPHTTPRILTVTSEQTDRFPHAAVNSKPGFMEQYHSRGADSVSVNASLLCSMRCVSLRVVFVTTETLIPDVLGDLQLIRSHRFSSVLSKSIYVVVSECDICVVFHVLL